MPGTSKPALGGERSTTLVAVLLTVGLLGPAVPLSGRVAPVPLSLAVGLFYAVVLLTVWAAARFATDSFAWDLGERPRFTVSLASSAWLVLGGQAAVPVYLFTRWRLLAPLALLVPLTWALAEMFLRVGGETDSLERYAHYGPMVVVVLLLVGGFEAGLRYAPGLW